MNPFALQASFGHAKGDLAKTKHCDLHPNTYPEALHSLKPVQQSCQTLYGSTPNPEPLKLTLNPETLSLSPINPRLPTGRSKIT